MGSSVSCPNERIVGVPGHCPQGFIQWSQRLIVLLGSACSALNPLSTETMKNDDAYPAPLSPTAGVLRGLEKWKETLPLHLRLEVTDALSPSSQRPLFLLHAQYNYMVVLMSRSALLRRATYLSNNGHEAILSNSLSLSEVCTKGGKSLGQLIIKLDAIGKFNATTWWDEFYTVASALVLVLDIICCTKLQQPGLAAASQTLLRELSSMAVKHLLNLLVPGSMRKWCSIVTEVSSMADQFVVFHSQSSSHSEIYLPDQQPRQLPPAASFYFGQDTTQHRTSNEAEPSEHYTYNRENENLYGGAMSSGEVHTQLTQLEEWCWDDIEAILKGSTSTQ
jgi:hypothetical protein